MILTLSILRDILAELAEFNNQLAEEHGMDGDLELCSQCLDTEKKLKDTVQKILEYRNFEMSFEGVVPILKKIDPEFDYEGAIFSLDSRVARLRHEAEEVLNKAKMWEAIKHSLSINMSYKKDGE